MSGPESPAPMLDAARVHEHRGDVAVGGELIVLGETSSTNVVLSELPIQRLTHGLAVVADHQSAGRGRLRRPWFSPPGVNLYTSVYVTGLGEARRAALFVYAVGLAVADAVAEAIDATPFLKWPNDVHLAGRKLGGILCETHPAPGAGVIVGIGLNVNVRPEDFPEEIRGHAASLRAHSGHDHDRHRVLGRLYRHLDRRYNQFVADTAGLLADWKAAAGVPGVRYQVVQGERHLAGCARDLSSDGALILETAEGERAEIFAGDVVAYDDGGPNAFRR
ncbi:MAG: biotin--[acetyl-CoA-carboxylase] ligase [Deltaproteobacteria bacterium]|nr:biotin--[acetyl-CoA-carboxylase] ligase [Deltaproteobacteria bacterium]MCB9489461.1 biotin--[acetyl-CoA-carboxylase] ligase [Deltaproteobacteria bacterium]